VVLLESYSAADLPKESTKYVVIIMVVIVIIFLQIIGNI